MANNDRPVTWWNCPRISIKDVVLVTVGYQFGSFIGQIIVELLRRALGLVS